MSQAHETTGDRPRRKLPRLRAGPRQAATMWRSTTGGRHGAGSWRTAPAPRNPTTGRRFRAGPWRTAATAALALAPLPAAAQPDREEVASVEFLGNAAFSDAELERAVFTTASGCPLVLAVTTCALGLDWGRDRSYYSPRVVEDDVERLKLLYRGHGFRGVEVEADAEPDEDGDVAVTFRIAEGDPFRIGSINFAGDSVPPQLGLARGLAVGPGDPLSFLLLDQTADTLARRLRNAGYARAVVLRRYLRPANADTATVTYDIELGPLATFGPIAVSGNRSLDDDVIVDRLPFREGQLYQEDLVQEGLRSLHELDIVARAGVDLDSARMDSDSVVPMRVSVEEGDRRRVRAGAGLNNAECFNVEGRWTNRSFLGGGRRLQAQAVVSNLLAGLLQPTRLCSEAGTGRFGRTNWLIRADFSQPSFLSRRTNLVAGFYAERRSRKNLFVRDAVGMDLGVSRRVGAGAFLGVRVSPEINRLDAAEVILCAAFLACNPSDVFALSGSNLLSPAAVSFDQDARDDLLNPRSGFRATVDVEAAGSATGSDYAYVRAFADGSLYREIDSRTVLALRLRVGRILGESGLQGTASRSGALALAMPPQKRFYSGGATSVRGFAQNTLGPRSLSVSVEELLRRREGGPACSPAAVLDLTCDGSALAGAEVYRVQPVGGLALFEASAELRFGSGGPLGGAAFVDVGQVWPRRVTLANLEFTPGLGLRYNTLFGPVRLDVAYSFRAKEPLQVVTSQLLAYDPAVHDAPDRVNIAQPNQPAEYVDWVVSQDLAVLQPRVLFGDDAGFSLRRFRVHFSIGQAF